MFSEAAVRNWISDKTGVALNDVLRAPFKGDQEGYDRQFITYKFTGVSVVNRPYGVALSAIVGDPSLIDRVEDYNVKISVDVNCYSDKGYIQLLHLGLAGNSFIDDFMSVSSAGDNQNLESLEDNRWLPRWQSELKISACFSNSDSIYLLQNWVIGGCQDNFSQHVIKYPML